MKVPLTYAEAKQRHPQEVAAAVRALRASSSKHKLAAPSKIEWEYVIAVRVEGFSMEEVRTGAVLKRMAERSKLPLETRIQDRLNDSSAILHASLEHWRHDSELLPKLPPEWVNHVRDEFQKALQERAAYEALPKGEKDAREQGRKSTAKRLV